MTDEEGSEGDSAILKCEQNDATISILPLVNCLSSRLLGVLRLALADLLARTLRLICGIEKWKSVIPRIDGGGVRRHPYFSIG